jgi:hypothetical protein
MVQEALVIRGRILARLLGLKLLTLDANIVTAPQSWLGPEPPQAGPPEAGPAEARPAEAGSPRRAGVRPGRPRALPARRAIRPASRPDRAPGPAAGGSGRLDGDAGHRRARAASAVPGSGIVRARQLVEQSARALDEKAGRP